MAVGKSTRVIRLHTETTEDGQGLRELQRHLNRAADGTADLDRRMGDLGDTSGTLQRKIDAARESVRRLGAQFAETEDREIGLALSRSRRQLAAFERIAKETMSPGARHDVGGGSWGPGNWDFSRTMSESRGAFIQGGIALAAANAPILAGVVATAITGAIAGAITAGGGILTAIRSERVREEWKDLGKDILAELDPVVTRFEGPMVRATERIGDAFVRARIPQTLGASADLVEPLADGLGEVVESLGPGLETSARRGLPAVKGLTKGVADIGRGVSMMLDDFADVGPEAARAFRDATHALALFTGETGDAIEGLVHVYELTRAPLMQQIPGLGARGMDLVPWTGLLGVIGKIGDASEDTSNSQDKLADDFKDAARAAAEEREAIDRLYDALDNLFSPKLDAQAEKFRLMGMLRDLPGDLARGDTIDDLASINSAVRQAIETRDALAKMPGADVNQVNAWYDQQILKIRAIGTQADITKAQLDQLTQPFRIPILVDFATSATSELAMMALRMVGAGRPGAAPTTGGTPAAGGGGGMWGDFARLIPGFASGGTTPAHTPFLVHKDEVLFADRQHYVATAAQARAMRDGGGVGGGAQAVTLHVTGDGGDFEQMMAKLIRRYVRVSGGGSVETTFSRRKR